MKKYINIHFKILEELYDDAFGVVYDYNFNGIEEKFDELIITFDAVNWDEQTKKSLLEDFQRIYPDAQIINEEIIEEKNWNEDWEKNVKSIVVNERIGITPLWKQDEIDSDIKIIINPKMSFGTGEHATTRLVCKLMENTVKKGSYWIDAGTGTGVLAILAEKLGAAKVWAFDNNIWSLNNAKENVVLNKCSVVEVSDSDIDYIELEKCDGISANLFANLLVQSFEKFKKALSHSDNNDLIVSGLLVYDEKYIIKCAKDSGFRHIKSLYEDEWVAIHFKTGNE